MAKLSAKSIQFIMYDGSKTSITTTYKVGNCKLTDDDLTTLNELRRVSREHHLTIDLRNPSAYVFDADMATLIPPQKITA